MELKTGPTEPIMNYCPSCWQERIMTTNGKCKTCGTDLVKRHWKTSIKKLEIVISLGSVIPLEIKGQMYVIPQGMMTKFSELKTYPEKIKFIEAVKKSCKSYKI